MIKNDWSRNIKHLNELFGEIKPWQKFHIGKPGEWEVETTVKEGSGND